MRIRAFLPILAIVPLLGSCGGTGPTSAARPPTPQGAAMQHMLADINRIRGFLYGSGSQGDATNAALDLVAWSKRIPELFPPELASQEYVDMSPERARAASQAMNTNAAELLAAVESGNHATIGDRLAETEHNGCGACHLSGTQ
ncbi:MAG TPA: cytochrome c [Acetobacteraceae bacterium]|nr:cytochrome c [Acetobacteraceae bacterium]